MDNIENIIEKYTQELMRFSLGDENGCKSVQPAAKISKAEEDSIEDCRNASSDSSDPYSESIKIYESYTDFLKANSGAGTLKVQVFGSDRAFPVVNARVTLVLVLRNEERMMFDGITDINGIADDIVLPAPDRELSQTPAKDGFPYSSYTLTVEKNGFAAAKFTDIPVFPGIKSIQEVELVPMTEDGAEPEQQTVSEAEPFSGGNF